MILSLVENNFADFFSVLQLRSEAPLDYYRWKYADLSNETTLPRGFLSFENGKVFGCIGIIPRLWTNGNGRIDQATWFSDWFVAPDVRGAGIGKELLGAVAQLSPYGMGIPGSAPAQKIASKFGYSPQPQASQIRIVINPWRYYWQYGGGSFPKRFLRAVIRSKNNPAPQLTDYSSIKVSFEFPEPSTWFQASEIHLKHIPHLLRTEYYLDWLSKMPPSPTGEANTWWHWIQKDLGLMGFIQRDRYNLKRCRVMDMWGNSPILSDIWLPLLKTMLENDVDYFEVYSSHDLPVIINAQVYKSVPFYTLRDAANTLSSGIDRENWFTDLIVRTKGSN
jgi:GNAT superfamily N-acetyltransferase